MDIIKDSEITQKIKFAISISKKKLGMEFIFSMQINTKVSTSCNYRFWWKWPDMSKVHKIGSW